MRLVSYIQVAWLGTTFVALPLSNAVAVTPADQYSFSSYVETAEAASSKPIPTTITWTASEQAEDTTDGNTLDHFVVVVTNDTDSELASITVSDITTRSITLNKDNVPGIKAASRYTVRVDEYYSDDDTSEGFDSTFYTRPPKLKNLRVKDKTLEADGDATVTLKWRQPVNLIDEYVYYDYKVVYPKNESRLVTDGYEWGSDVNSAVISNLPARTLKVKVRARSDSFGTGKWSAWKTFSAPVAE